MAGDDANFTLRLINQITGPAKAAMASLRGVKDAFSDVNDGVHGVNQAMGDLQKSSRSLTKLEKAAAFTSIAAHTVTAAHGNVLLTKAFGGFDKLKAVVFRMGAGIKAFGASAVAGAKKLAPFVVGGAGIYGIGKLAAGVAIPALGGIALAIGAVIAAAAVAAIAVAAIGAKFAAAAIESAAFGQKSVKALELLIGNGVTAAREFDAVRKEAEGLGLDIHDTQKSFQKLLAAQFEIGKAKELIRMGADLQAIGASGEEVSRAMLAITQIKSKGKLQAEEMLQLQEAGISAALVYEALGKRLGKTNTELRKLQEQGKIGADVGLEAIMEAVGKKTGAKNAGDAGRDFATSTLDGMKNVMRAGLANLFIDIGQAILPTLMPLAEKVMEVFREVLASPEVADLGRKLLSEFKYFAAWVDAEWPNIKAVIGDTLKVIVALVGMTAEAVAFMARNWDYIRPVLEGVAWGFGAITAVVMLLIAALAGLAVPMLASIAGLVDAVIFIVSLVPRMFEAGVQLVDGLIGGIKSRVVAAIEAIKQVGTNIKDAFCQAMGIASPSKVMAELGLNLSEGLAVGISANDNVVRAATVDTARVSEQSAASAGAAGGGRGGNLTLNMDVQRQSGGESDEAFAERVGAVVQRKLDGFFEGIALTA